MAVDTIKRRSDFLAIRGGVRSSMPCCLIEAKPRAPERTKICGPRFGFTVTKKLGNAVKRNRIRRRLKSAINQIAPLYARDGFDYVLVARHSALEKPFADLLRELSRALKNIHKPQENGEQRLDKYALTMKKPQQQGPA